MKRLMTAIVVTLITTLATSCAQIGKGKEENKQEVQNQTVQTTGIARYKLYPTENLWTFIKLDTRTGQIWQLQYTVDEDKGRFEYDLNPQPLLLAGMQPVDGRYELYPTKNMYNFVLVDQIEGATWQVQWSLDDDKRMVLPISR